MLPGGLRVLGILLVDAPEINTSSSHFAFKKKIEKLLEDIETVNSKTSFVTADDESFEVSLYVMRINRKAKSSQLQIMQLHVGPDNEICKDVGLKWKQSDIKSAEIEDKISSGPWQVVKANFVLDYPVVFTPDQTEGLTLSGKVDIALEEVKRSISFSTVLFDGMKRVHSSNGKYLDPSLKDYVIKKDGGKKSKGKSSKKHPNYEQTDDSLHFEEETSIKEYTADILLGAYSDHNIDNLVIDNDITVDSGSRLRFCGKMCIRVYMRPRATIKEASNAVKEDILRSLRARLEMHCDSLVGEETKGTEKEGMPIVHEPPRRCLIGLPQRENKNLESGMETDPIMISDFLFPGETSYDSIDSVNEVFGFEPSIERMDDDQELVAGIQHLNMNGSGELTARNVTHTGQAEQQDGTSGKFESPSKIAAEATKRSNCNLVAILLSVIVAIVGICVSYLAMSTGTNSNEEEFVVPSRTKDHHPNSNFQ